MYTSNRPWLVFTDIGGDGGTPPADPDLGAPDPGDEPGDPAPVKPTETVDYWKRRSRENEAKAKANADAAKRLADLEDRDKTEQQRAADALAAAQKAAADAQAETVRYRAAAEHGITGGDIDLLGGGDQEDVLARAERIGALLAAERELGELKAQKGAPPSHLSRQHWRPGAAPADQNKPESSADLAAAAAARRGRTT